MGSQELEIDRGLDAVQWHQLPGSNLFGVSDAEQTPAIKEARRLENLAQLGSIKGRQIKDESFQKLLKARKTTSGSPGDITSNMTSPVPQAVMGVRKTA